MLPGLDAGSPHGVNIGATRSIKANHMYDWTGSGAESPNQRRNPIQALSSSLYGSGTIHEVTLNINDQQR